MMKLNGILLLVLFTGCTRQNQKQTLPCLLTLISKKINYAVQLAETLKVVSRHTTEDGKLKLVPSHDCTCGFNLNFPGGLAHTVEFY